MSALEQHLALDKKECTGIKACSNQYSLEAEINHNWTTVTVQLKEPRLLAKVSTFSPKFTVNKLELCNKKILSAVLNLIAALNLDRLLSARLQY